MTATANLTPPGQNAFNLLSDAACSAYFPTIGDEVIFTKSGARVVVVENIGGGQWTVSKENGKRLLATTRGLIPVKCILCGKNHGSRHEIDCRARKDQGSFVGGKVTRIETDPVVIREICLRGSTVSREDAVKSILSQNRKSQD